MSKSEELNEFGNPYPTLSEMADKYDELYKDTFSYQAMALRESVIVFGKELAVIFVNPSFNVFEAIADILYRYLAIPIIEWLNHSSDEQEPEKRKGNKRVSVEGFERILYLRTHFNRDDCERIAISIFSTSGQMDMLEFAICASHIGYSADDVLREFIHHGYYHKIKAWREEYPPKLWDCMLTASDFDNPKDLLGDNVLVRHNGEILLIEDAPPVEMLNKRKNG